MEGKRESPTLEDMIVTEVIAFTIHNYCGLGLTLSSMPYRAKFVGSLLHCERFFTWYSSFRLSPKTKI